jgi:hypothetical protein
VSTVKISHPILKALEGYLKLNFQSWKIFLLFSITRSQFRL